MPIGSNISLNSEMEPNSVLFFNPCLHSIILPPLRPVQHHLVPCAALSPHTKWPWKAPGWYFHVWVLLQMGAWDPLLPGRCLSRSMRRRIAGHLLLAPCWPPSPTISSCSFQGLAHTASLYSNPHSCCLGQCQAAVNKYTSKVRHVVTEVGGPQKCNCQAASEKAC